MVRIAINGYGRIGRVAHRIIIEKRPEIEVVAINAGKSTDLAGWMYLLKYDTNYGILKNHTFSVKAPEQKPLNIQTEAEFLGWLTVDNYDIAIFADRKPENLPWKDLQIDAVIESTGAFVKHEDLMLHIKAGAKSVILSAPYKGDTPVPTYVLGVNSNPAGQSFSDVVINNASCTTNSISPVAKLLEDNFGIENIFAHRAVLYGNRYRGSISKIERWDKIEQTIRVVLKIPKAISRVEGYDISNISGREATGSMVVFIDGHPAKSEYRKFKIRTVFGSNDVAMLQEVIRRRLKHTEWRYPNLMLIDGGRPQLNAAIAALSNFQKPYVVALAKREEELYTEKGDIAIRLSSLPQDVAYFFQRVRDESHRFAKKYHHKLREISYRAK